MEGVPPDEAYETVTNPERFQAVVDVARALVADLTDRFDVVVTPDSTAFDDISYVNRPPETVRLTPRQGVPMAFGLFDQQTRDNTAGVVARVGNWFTAEYPDCCCDACDLQPEELIDEMQALVDAAVNGAYREERTRRRLRYSYPGRQVDYKLTRQERAKMHGRGSHHWPPWPSR